MSNQNNRGMSADQRRKKHLKLRDEDVTTPPRRLKIDLPFEEAVARALRAGPFPREKVPKWVSGGGTKEGEK